MMRNELRIGVVALGLAASGCCLFTGGKDKTDPPGMGEPFESIASPGRRTTSTPEAGIGERPAESTPESCNPKKISQPVVFGEALKEMGQGESDFAANGGYSCAVIQDIGGAFSSDALYMYVIDGSGKVVATRESTAQRLEYWPSVVAAPWGGFVVAYHWTEDTTVEWDHVVARTLGYDGKWSDEGWIISTMNDSDKKVMLRNQGDKVGVWWAEFAQKSGKYRDEYVEIVERVKTKASYPGKPPALDDPVWRAKLEAVEGWPVPKGNKGVRIRWDGGKFVVMWKKARSEGTRYQFNWFSAECE